MKQNQTLLLVGGGLLAAFVLLKPEAVEKAAGSVTNVFGGGGASAPQDIGGIIETVLGGVGGAVGAAGVAGAAGAAGLLPDLGIFDNIFGGLNEKIKELQAQLAAAAEAAKNAVETAVETVGGGNGNGDGNGNGGSNFYDLAKMAIGEPANIILAIGESAQGVGEGAIKVGTGAAVLGGTYLGVKTLAPVVPAVGRGLATIVTGAGRALITPVSALPILGTGLAVVGAGATGYWIGSKFNATPAGQSLQRWSGEQGTKFANTPIGKWIWWRNESSEYGESIYVPPNWGSWSAEQRKKYLNSRTQVVVRASASTTGRTTSPPRYEVDRTPEPTQKAVTYEVVNGQVFTITNGERRRGL